MKLSNYLKQQFADIVDAYESYFQRTFFTALIYTVICFLCIGLLVKLSTFDTTSGKKQISMLSYFLVRYSSKETYSIVDLAKSLLIFFISLYSLGILRLSGEEAARKKIISFGLMLKKLRVYDFVVLSGILILSSGIDLLLFRLSVKFKTIITIDGLQKWLIEFLFLLRIYVPLILFSGAIYKLTSTQRLGLGLRKIVFLFITLWLFNEFSYELLLFVRLMIFDLVYIPFSKDKIYALESILGIPFVAFLFIGYSAAMTSSLKRWNEEVE